MGVAVGDYDNDGNPDLFVTNYGQDTLFHNNGNGTFTDATGPKATFRMVDSSLELELAKWGGGRAYELRAYDMSKSDGANRNANRAFDRFKTALIDGLKHKCAI